MGSDVFLLLKDPDNPCRDIIYHRDGTLRIRVFCLSGENFNLDPEEIQFFADDNGEMLAFETASYHGEDPGLIIEAIRWYASYIQNPDLEILADDPRTEL
ncbi:MAG TPA: hypothetical protein VNI52_00745 [Sphingobacteriaceae bacterium]|nr:hypothetical protein [Sphingobacteriaceae bacterium]